MKIKNLKLTNNLTKNNYIFLIIICFLFYIFLYKQTHGGLINCYSRVIKDEPSAHARYYFFFIFRKLHPYSKNAECKKKKNNIHPHTCVSTNFLFNSFFPINTHDHTLFR